MISSSRMVNHPGMPMTSPACPNRTHRGCRPRREEYTVAVAQKEVLYVLPCKSL